jgi:hypothetical protein
MYEISFKKYMFFDMYGGTDDFRSVILFSKHIAART